MLVCCGGMAGGVGPGKARACGSGGNNTKVVCPGKPQHGGEFGAAAGVSSGSDKRWPDLKKRHLILQSRRELRGLDLFSVPGFLTAIECVSFIRSAEALGFQQQGSLGPKFGEAFRDNGRVSLQSASVADKLWKAGLSSLFQDVMVDGKRAVGLNPNIRFYRYGVGQRFGQHYDESAEVKGQNTQYTLLIYLTGGDDSNAKKPSKGQLVGGETVFYDRKRVIAEVPPVAGMALLHIHGEQCLLHEAKVVLKGVKYVLRSDVVFN